jgi:type 1 glutamine amidotransferase
MYNPAMRPFVSHFTGTDLIVEHIEKWVCPTITSDQLLGGHEFRFRADRRPHLVIISAEDEYRTEVSLPAFAAAELGHEFRVSFVFGDATERYHLPGIELIDSADLLLVSVRRRPLPADQLAAVRRYVASGKPVVGIRTASHAFCLRNQPAPAGLADWPEFDAEVFGGSYTNHYGADRPTTVSVLNDSPLLTGLERREFPSGGSLYQVSPLNPRAVPILQGSIENAPPEPVAWTFLRGDGGRSFYTSLGHVDDFAQPEFRQLLKNALVWAAQAD